MDNRNVDFNETLKAWANIVITIWEDKIEKLHINRTNSLLNSFVSHVVTNAKGDPVKIEFAFLFYGRFVDMGVGNGVSMDMLKSGLNTSRKPKPWYSKAFFYQVSKLGPILGKKYARKVQVLVTDNISM